MVAIRSILTLMFALGVASLSAQEIKPRVAGLENNKEYMALLREDGVLRGQVDSLSQAIATLRARFVEDTENRKDISAEILRLEGDAFALQGKRNLLPQRLPLF